MNREEAIRKVENCLTDYFPIEDYGEVEEIIKALKKEPCEDAISRKAMLDYQQYLQGRMPNEENYKLWKFIKDLPSVTPAQKRDEWIPCSERPPKKSGKYLCTFGTAGRTDNIIGIDYYTTESYAKRWFEEPEEYIGWESNCVIAWMPLPTSYQGEITATNLTANKE